MRRLFSLAVLASWAFLLSGALPSKAEDMKPAEPTAMEQIKAQEKEKINKDPAEAIWNLAPVPVKADSAWMLVSTALVMLMTPGLALFYGGMARRKNILGTMMHSMVPWQSSASTGSPSVMPWHSANPG